MSKSTIARLRQQLPEFAELEKELAETKAKLEKAIEALEELKTGAELSSGFNTDVNPGWVIMFTRQTIKALKNG